MVVRRLDGAAQGALGKQKEGRGGSAWGARRDRKGKRCRVAGGWMRWGGVGGLVHWHTPSIAFRHLPPNSARFGYATEGALFTSAQLSTDAVRALRKVLVLI